MALSSPLVSGMQPNPCATFSFSFIIKEILFSLRCITQWKANTSPFWAVGQSNRLALSHRSCYSLSQRFLCPTPFSPRLLRLPCSGVLFTNSCLASFCVKTFKKKTEGLVCAFFKLKNSFVEVPLKRDCTAGKFAALSKESEEISRVPVFVRGEKKDSRLFGMLLLADLHLREVGIKHGTHRCSSFVRSMLVKLTVMFTARSWRNSSRRLKQVKRAFSLTFTGWKWEIASHEHPSIEPGKTLNMFLLKYLYCA